MSQSDYSEDELSSYSAENTDSEVEEENSEERSDSDSSEDLEHEDIDVWASIQNQATEKHQQEHEILVQKYQQNGDSDDVAEMKANNALLSTYRKELREVLFDKLKWMHLFRRDPIYKKIIASRKNLMDVEDYDWEEATQSAINQRKFLLNKLFSKEEIPKQSLNHNNRFHPYARPFTGFY